MIYKQIHILKTNTILKIIFLKFITRIIDVLLVFLPLNSINLVTYIKTK